MNRQETQVAKDIVIEKLNQVSPELIPTVSNFLDRLIETQKETLATDTESNSSEISRNEWIDTWDQWFREVDELPLSDPLQVNLTKAELNTNGNYNCTKPSPTTDRNPRRSEISA
jgi:hypothetical protein